MQASSGVPALSNVQQSLSHVSKHLVVPVISLLSFPFLQVIILSQEEAIVISLLLSITSVPPADVAAGFSKIPASAATLFCLVTAEVGPLVGVAVKPFAAESVPRRSSLGESKMSATTPDLTRKVNTVDRRVATPLG